MTACTLQMDISAVRVRANFTLNRILAQNRMKKPAVGTFTATKLALISVSTIFVAILRVFKFTNFTVVFLPSSETMRTLSNFVLLTNSLLFISR